MAWDRKVPFRGRHQQTDIGWYNRDKIEYREVEPFRARLKVESYYRGRSSFQVAVRNLDNHEVYYMSIKDLWPFLEGKELDGAWKFKKQGRAILLTPQE